MAAMPSAQPLQHPDGYCGGEHRHQRFRHQRCARTLRRRRHDCQRRRRRHGRFARHDQPRSGQIGVQASRSAGACRPGALRPGRLALGGDADRDPCRHRLHSPARRRQCPRHQYPCPHDAADRLAALPERRRPPPAYWRRRSKTISTSGSMISPPPGSRWPRLSPADCQRSLKETP